MRPVVYSPGIPGHAGARGQAGQDCIETFTLKAVARQRRWVADITEAQRRCAEQPGRVARYEPYRHAGARAHETNHLVATLQQRAHSGAADGPGGSEHQHALSHQSGHPACRQYSDLQVPAPGWTPTRPMINKASSGNWSVPMA